MEKLNGESLNIVNGNIEKLKEIFPEIFSEGKIDCTKLEEELGDYIEKENEKYNFTWNGKQAAKKIAQTSSTGTLIPCKEDSKNWDTTQNLYIEGDNLEVLKLLQKSYHKKIKMIYIDPPYNTGNDFVYKDNFKDNITNYLEVTGQVDSEGNRLSINSEVSGRYHSDWLNMMYPRLKLARNLLKEDGAIFISIGVEELTNLKAITNEIFGENNFVEIFSWVKTSTPPALSTKSRKTNEYILCYEKNKNSHKYNGEKLDGGDQPLLNSGNKIRELKFPKEKVYFKEDKFPNAMLLNGKPDRVTLKNDIEIHNGYATQNFILEGEFKWTQEFLNEEIEKGTTFIIKSEKLSIRFTRDEEGYKRPTNFIKEKYTTPLINKPNNAVGTNENASNELNNLLGGDYFDYPKPVSLIKYLINFICIDDDLVLDFFSGSATTGESIFKYNLENSTNLHQILVQLPEYLDPKNARDANEKKKIQSSISFLESINKPINLAEIGKERIRSAGEKIKEDNPDKDLSNLDIGFKVFKLDSSNIKEWDSDFDNLEANLLDSVENIKEDRTSEDLLYEILLKYGLDLTLPIEEKVINGKTVYIIGFGALVVCLDDEISIDIVEEIAKLKEEYQSEVMRVVFKDSGFKDAVVKTNAIQVLKQFGIDEVVSV